MGAASKFPFYCGAIAGPLFVAAFLVEGATRAGYDPLRHPVSSLAIGAYGWTQVATFIVTGLLTLAFAVGLRRDTVWGSILIGTYTIGLIGAGVFVTDPVSGYPPGTPASGPRTVSGELHDLFSLLVFLGLPAACGYFTRRFAAMGAKGWAGYSAATGVLFAIAFVVTGIGFSQHEALVGVAGLTQRLTLVIGWTWLTLLAIRFTRR